MRTESIEIYSDQVNAAIMRHPNRRFPGVLIQGDSLYSMYVAVRDVLDRGELPEEAKRELADLCDQLAGYINNYKVTLKDHGIELPFVERR